MGSKRGVMRAAEREIWNRTWQRLDGRYDHGYVAFACDQAVERFRRAQRTANARRKKRPAATREEGK